MNRNVMKRIESIDIYIGHRDPDYDTQPHHFHNWYEIFIVTEGECCFFVYDKSYKAGKGSVILLRPGVFHYYTSKIGCEYVVIEIAPGYISRFFTTEAADMLFGCFETDTLCLDEREVLECLRLAAVARNSSPKSLSDKFLSIGSLLSLLNGKCTPNAQTRKANPHKGSVEKLNFITDYISSHYKQIHSAADITKNCYISKSHLFRLFKQELGQSVSDYINNLKINAAGELLISTDMSILDIALECGFNSPQYFYKTFKQRLGCSPREYVKNPAVKKSSTQKPEI